MQENAYPTRFSEDLHRVLAFSEGKPMTLRQLREMLRGRGGSVLIVILGLPFCIPVIDILFTGLSAPFGLILMFMGVGVAIGKEAWLPKKYLDREIPYGTLEKVVRMLLRLSVRMEKIIHPRLFFLQSWPFFRFLNGTVITAMAFLLGLPLLIPLTNALPALSIVILAAGLVEEDGLFILGGYLMATVTTGYFAFLFLAGKIGLEKIGIHLFSS